MLLQHYNKCYVVYTFLNPAPRLAYKSVKRHYVEALWYIIVMGKTIDSMRFTVVYYIVCSFEDAMIKLL